MYYTYPHYLSKLITDRISSDGVCPSVALLTGEARSLLSLLYNCRSLLYLVMLRFNTSYYLPVIAIIAFIILCTSCLSDMKIPSGDNNDSEVAVVYSTEYIEDADSYLFSNGYALSVFEESNTENFRLFIDSLDFSTGNWIEEKAMAVLCDQSFRPLVIIDQNNNLFEFEYSDNNTFTLKVTDSNQVESVYHDINIQEYLQSKITKSNEILSNIGNTLNIIDIAMTVANRGDLTLNIASMIVPSLFPEGLPSSFAGLGMSTIGAYFAKGALGYAGLAVSYFQVIDDLKEWKVRDLIGDIEPFIYSVEPLDQNNVNLQIHFNGDFMLNRKESAVYRINYWKELNGKRVGNIYSTNMQEAEYGFTTETLFLDTAGNYCFQVVVYPVSYTVSGFLMTFYNVESNIAHLNLSPLYLKNCSVNDDYFFEDGFVQYNINLELSYLSDQDEFILSNYDEYGVYGVNGDGSKEYFPVKENGGLEFKLALVADKNKFDINYSDYEAICSAYPIGVYVKDGFGIITCYDEQPVELLYDRRPSVSITDFVQGETVPYSDEDGRDLRTYVNYEIVLDGALFVDEIFEYNVGSFENPGKKVLDIKLSDDSYSYNGSYLYYSEYSTNEPAYTYIGISVNGQEIFSSNCIYCDWPAGRFSLVQGQLMSKCFSSSASAKSGYSLLEHVVMKNNRRTPRDVFSLIKD